MQDFGSEWQDEKMILHFIDLNYVPVKKSMMFWILKEYRETSNVSWKVRGRTPKISNDKFKNKIVEFQNNQAR